MTPPFAKVFIANRGEIAVRVARACRELGIRSVAAVSDADLDAVHAGAADEVARIGPAEARESYLHVERVVAAAVDTGCDALHPGYGFLAENAALAEACEAAGLTWVGPPPAALALVGDKVAARLAMRDAGVPLVPGTFEATADLDALVAAAGALSYPLLVKARGGGGGTGMRRVDGADTLAAALAEASAEAGAAFDDPALFLEQLLAPVRHVEVQVLADAHGTTIALGERECSVQRRHQKVIEESPSPAVDDTLRARLCDAAVTAARAAGYVNAGTVEFLLTAEGTFHFLEVNARIQVEHPVTEARFGVDLVAWQLRVAAGEPLDPALAAHAPRGCAIEARLYAEDPDAGLLPSAGRIAALQLPAGPGIRVDAGVVAGSAVPLEYDPILAKLIAWGPDRDSARRRLIAALRETVVLGVASNAWLLRHVLEQPAFADGEVDTGWLEREVLPALPGPDEASADVARIAAALALDERAPATDGGGGAATSGPRAVPGPWDRLGGRRFPDGGTR